MIAKKTLFLLPAIIILSTTALYSMNKPEAQAENAGQQEQPAPAEKTPLDELHNAKAQYWAHKQQRDKSAEDLQERIHSFRGYTEQAVAQQSVALAFRGIDRSINFGIDELRRKCNLLTEEELLAQEIAQKNKLILDEALNEKKANTELNNASTKTQEAQKSFLRSQQIFQDIVTAEKACNIMPGRFDNPACQKRLNELFALAGMPLDKKE